jgi:lipopolysaccharide transport system ATP-binding protein
MSIAIQVNELSKQYRLGEVGTGSLAHDVNRWWHRLRGREDPYSRVGESNDRTVKGASDYVWALKDIGFEIRQGEVVGIIGRNGAGKSTLLKILSRVTSPTTGSVRAKGRIASLLEVGTGFHPELTGRENIYLNGAILGMRKKEISIKLDEIIDFSGCERYIDTPVKRYSSGMYVRLAFAVAAHLDPEILIIDEVLAVGDGEFQIKCMGRMQEMHKHGRTVLIVSHQMSLIHSLCESAILLNNGTVECKDATPIVLQRYIEGSSPVKPRTGSKLEKLNLGDHRAKLHHVLTCNEKGEAKQTFQIDEPADISFEYEIRVQPPTFYYASVEVYTETGHCVFASSDATSRINSGAHLGVYKSICTIPARLLNTGRYSIRVALVSQGSGGDCCFYADSACHFRITEDVYKTLESERNYYAGEMIGFVRPKLQWKTMPISEEHVC